MQARSSSLKTLDQSCHRNVLQFSRILQIFVIVRDGNASRKLCAAMCVAKFKQAEKKQFVMQSCKN